MLTRSFWAWCYCQYCVRVVLRKLYLWIEMLRVFWTSSASSASSAFRSLLTNWSINGIQGRETESSMLWLLKLWTCWGSTPQHKDENNLAIDLEMESQLSVTSAVFTILVTIFEVGSSRRIDRQKSDLKTLALYLTSLEGLGEVSFPLNEDALSTIWCGAVWCLQIDSLICASGLCYLYVISDLKIWYIRFQSRDPAVRRCFLRKYVARRRNGRCFYFKCWRIQYFEPQELA